MAKIKSCGVLIFRNNPKRSFLLMRHPKRWDLPKGHVDKNESELECALRELVEETGIRDDQIELDDKFRFSQEYIVNNARHGNVPKKKELVIFLAELKTPCEITVTEHTGYEWFDWAPPHQIQLKTIDPLLAQVADYWKA